MSNTNQPRRPFWPSTQFRHWSEWEEYLFPKVRRVINQSTEGDNTLFDYLAVLRIFDEAAADEELEVLCNQIVEKERPRNGVWNTLAVAANMIHRPDDTLTPILTFVDGRVETLEQAAQRLRSGMMHAGISPETINHFDKQLAEYGIDASRRPNLTLVRAAKAGA